MEVSVARTQLTDLSQDLTPEEMKALTGGRRIRPTGSKAVPFPRLRGGGLGIEIDDFGKNTENMVEFDTFPRIAAPTGN